MDKGQYTLVTLLKRKLESYTDFIQRRLQRLEGRGEQVGAEFGRP